MTKFYTEKGNLCDPRMEHVLTWISSGWLGFGAESIIKSFRSCGVGSNDITEYHTYLREFLENGYYFFINYSFL